MKMPVGILRSPRLGTLIVVYADIVRGVALMLVELTGRIYERLPAAMHTLGFALGCPAPHEFQYATLRAFTAVRINILGVKTLRLVCGLLCRSRRHRSFLMNENRGRDGSGRRKIGGQIHHRPRLLLYNVPPVSHRKRDL